MVLIHIDATIDATGGREDNVRCEEVEFKEIK